MKFRARAWPGWPDWIPAWPPLGGFCLFPAIFALGFKPGRSRPGVYYPAGRFCDAEPFSSIVFLSAAIAALTSAIPSEVVTAWLIDEKGWSRRKAAACMGVVIFIVGLPATLIQCVEGLFLSWFEYRFARHLRLVCQQYFSALVGGFFMAVFTGYACGELSTQFMKSIKGTRLLPSEHGVDAAYPLFCSCDDLYFGDRYL